MALQLVPRPRAKRVDFQIIVEQRGSWVDQDNRKQKIAEAKFDGTIKRGSATCPCCGYTTPVTRVRDQLRERRGGTDDACLMAVVTTRSGKQGRFYRLPTVRDQKSFAAASAELRHREAKHQGRLSLSPDELLPQLRTLGFRVQPYGMTQWRNLFNSRQLLALTTLARLVRAVGERLRTGEQEALALPVQAALSLGIGRLADRCCALCTWDPTPTASGILHLFGRQAVPMVWDYAEGLPLEAKSGGWMPSLEWIALVLEHEARAEKLATAQTELASATRHPLPDDSVVAFVTDPPYYDAVPYADLSQFFVVWLKRELPNHPWEFDQSNECIVDDVSGKDRAYFERTMKQAMAEGRRLLSPNGIGVVVFAHKSTAGWETQLQAMIDAGWTMTGSWPIDTEMGNRLRAMGSAALASSVHLVCRPRENPDGYVRTDEVGDWRDVLVELPRRIHEWMPRLAEEGVVGADAIFACLGPALEIFSRYSRVEKSNGETVPLSEYLVQVWAAVSKEALSMIFKDADTAGLEPDARLTAMWLWTLGGGAPATAGGGEEAGEEEADDEESGKTAKTAGFVLEFDAARKIAQGLGVHLEKASSVVEVKGETARLLSVAERTKHLFGKEGDDEGGKARRKKKEPAQRSLFAELEAVEKSAGTAPSSKVPTPTPGATVLDQVHQAMILFAAGRGAAVGTPEANFADIETVLEALASNCFYLNVDRNRYRFGLRPNLNQMLVARRGGVKDKDIEERVRQTTSEIFGQGMKGLDRRYFPAKSNDVPDKPQLCLVILGRGQPAHDPQTKTLIEGIVREAGTSGRSFKSALIFMAADEDARIADAARTLIAWEDISNDADSVGQL